MASDASHKTQIPFECMDMPEMQVNVNWDDVICPICLDFPHNGVLLYCSSYDKGCRPFICNTDHTQSNCLERFKSAYGLPTSSKESSVNREPVESIQESPTKSSSCPPCPLCRGDVTGWIVVSEARVNLNTKKRCCQQKQCLFIGNYMELQVHVEQNHPNASSSEIDPVRKLEWENFQQSSEIMDVLSTINSEVPHGMVLGDYVIEYGNESGDEYEDFPGDEGNWWTSCILYQVFDNFRASRNRPRSRVGERRSRQTSSFDVSNVDDDSGSSVDVADYRLDETDGDDEIIPTSVHGNAASGGHTSRRSYRRRRVHL